MLCWFRETDPVAIFLFNHMFFLEPTEMTAKRTYYRGRRVRQGGVKRMATAVSLSPSPKKARTLFANTMPNCRGPTLQATIVHLMAEDGEANTDAHPSYAAVGLSLGPDVIQNIVNHSNTEVWRFIDTDGERTNHVEAVHGVMKWKLRRQFWQMHGKRRSWGSGQ